MEQQGDLRLRTLITVIRRPNTSLKLNAGRGDENILFCAHRLTTHRLVSSDLLFRTLSSVANGSRHYQPSNHNHSDDSRLFYTVPLPALIIRIAHPMRLFLSGRYLKWFVIVELLGLMILGVMTGFLGFIAEMALSAMLGYGLIRRSGETLKASQQQFSQLNQLDPRALPRHIVMVVGGFLMILPGLLTDAAGVLIVLIGYSASLRQSTNRRTHPHQDSAIIEGEFEASVDQEMSAKPNADQLPPGSKPKH